MRILYAIVRHWELKILALVLAGLVWLHVVTNQVFELDVDYGLDYVNLPSTLILAAPPPVRASVRLRGPGKTLLRLLWQDRRWPVDLSAVDVGAVTVRLRPEATPRYGLLGLEAVSIDSPDGLSLLVDSFVHKSVPAQLGALLQPAAGFTFVGEPILSPDVVRLTGPRGALEDIDGVRTRSTAMPDLRETVRTTISLIQPPGYNIEMEPRTVGLYRQVEPYATRALTAVPVRVIGARADDSLRVTPDVVTVEIGGPRSAAVAASPESIQVVYRAAADDTTGAQVGLQVTVAPPLSVLKVEPDSVTLQRRVHPRPHSRHRDIL